MTRVHSSFSGESPRGAARAERRRVFWRWVQHSGIVHSALIHMVMLLLLALVGLVSESRERIAVELSFDNVSAESPSFESIPDVTAIATVLPDEPAQKTPSANSEPDAQVTAESPDIAVCLEDVAAVPPDDQRQADPPVAQLVAVIVRDREVDVNDEVPAAGRSTAATVSAVRARMRLRSGAAGMLAALDGARGRAEARRDGGGGGGSGVGIDGRLRKANAQSGAVQISIAWNSIDDIDLHVQVDGSGGLSETISWMNRQGAGGGTLDVDMNAVAGMLSSAPVENVFWPIGRPPVGRITVGVHHFRTWSGQRAVPVIVVVKVANELPREFQAVAVLGAAPRRVFTFEVGK